MQGVSLFKVDVPHFNLGDFSDLSSIARGGEGEVSRGTHNKLGIVAVKTLFVPVSIDKHKELEILARTKTPLNVKLFGILISNRDSTLCSGYVMELMKFESPSLNSVIYDPSTQYDMRQVYSWIEQAGRGLKYLHEDKIIHRDIKPNNMLLASMDELKIAGVRLTGEIAIDGSITGGIETCFYMAPEIIETRPYGPAADVYAFIISIWEIVHRKRPYYDLKDRSMDTFLKEVTENRRRPNIKDAADYSKYTLKVDAEMRELIQKGWDADPAKRVTIDEIIKYAKQKKDGILHMGEKQIPWYEEAAFKIPKRIGEGGYANVYQGEFGGTPAKFLRSAPSKPVAIKKFHKAISIDTSKEWQEIEILIKANNKNLRIVKLLGITIDNYDKTACSGYIMEYMQNGSLDRVIHDKSINYDLTQIYFWLCQAACGIMYLHEQKIIHRDIKPSNLLLGNTLDDLKVADFGLARYTSGESSKTRGVGTDGYTAPEVFETGKYNNAADVYSFTITIWEILHRKKPCDEFKKEITKHDSTSKEGWRPAVESSLIEPHMERLLKRGWHIDPHQRTTFKEILDTVQPIVEVQPTILVLGAFKSNKMYLLSRDRTWWSTLSLKLPTFMCRGGAVYLDGEIYIFGAGHSNKTYKLNREMKWIQLADMNEKRPWISNNSVAFDGCIWVFGGRNNSGKRNSVEKYIPEENKWIQMPSMIEERTLPAAAALKGKLFVSGGHVNYRKLKSMECFDPASQKWTMFLDLPSPVFWHAMISDGICLTILGEGEEHKSVWKINPNEEKATWKELPQMREGRGQFTANLLGDNIFAMGELGSSKKVEFFNGETWKDGPELPEELHAMCSIVIPAHLTAALTFHH